jgi:hypothetical protein
MRQLLILALAGLLMAGCAEVASTPTAQPVGSTPAASAPGTSGAYPSPQNAYPAPQPSVTGYPAPSSLPQGPKFTLNTPIKASDSQVTGTGPAGVPIKLIDLTQAGQEIAQTTIGADGTFRVDVGGKLVSTNEIALMLGNTQGTNINQNDFTRGPGYQDFPQLGILFTSAVVQ